MKILFLTASFFKHGAVAKYAVELAERLVGEHEVHVLTSRYEHKIKGLHVHEVPIPWWPHWLQVGANAIKNTVWAKRLDRRHGFDIIHSQGAESLYQNVLKAPSCHLAAVEQFKRERGPAYRILKTLEPATNIVLPIERYNYTHLNFERAIVLSKGLYRELQHHYDVPDEKLALIPNGVNIKEFTPENRGPFRADERKRLGLSEEDVALAFVGWEFKRKGLQFIIEALPRLPSHVKAIAVGGDDPAPYEALAKKLGVADRLIFTGKSKDVKRQLAAADIFVFPTSYEGFSMATLEAAAAGLPVIATKVNGTEDLIREGENGYFIEREPDSIAEKVELMLSGKRIEKMGAAARECALAHSWDNIAQLTEDLYIEIKGSRS